MKDFYIVSVHADCNPDSICRINLELIPIVGAVIQKNTDVNLGDLMGSVLHLDDLNNGTIEKQKTRKKIVKKNKTISSSPISYLEI